jgi:hypothetical protein
MWTHTVTVLTVRILLVFQQLTNTDKINLLLVTRSKNSGLFWHLKELVGDWFFRSPLPDSGQVPEIIFQFSGLTSLRSHTSEDRTRHVCTKYCSICERLWMLVPGRILFFLICSGWSSGKGQFRAWLKRTRRKVGGLLWLSTWVVPTTKCHRCSGFFLSRRLWILSCQKVIISLKWQCTDVTSCTCTMSLC